MFAEKVLLSTCKKLNCASAGCDCALCTETKRAPCQGSLFLLAKAFDILSPLQSGTEKVVRLEDAMEALSIARRGP